MLTRGAVALAAAFALAACSDDPLPPPMTGLMSEPVPSVLSQAAPQPAAPQMMSQSDTVIRDVLDSAPELNISGERLNVDLLKRFYARHGFEPVWPERQAQANALIGAVLRAHEQGLDPELFHASLLKRGATLSPLELELVLSDAVLSYADGLARGVAPVERRKDDEVLAPEPIDVAAVLDNAIDSPDPAGMIEALAPTTPTYLALRQALLNYRAAPPAPSAVAPMPIKATRGNRMRPIDTTNRLRAIDTTSRLRAIEVNLERQRWLPRQLPADRAWVNIADERLVLYRAGQPVFTTRVVVGEDVEKNQSPEFSATINASFYNPPWVIPADIAKAEILPKITQDPDYLNKNKMVMLDNGEVEQLPGPDAGLGLIMFDMPNRFDVYLHDTPDRYIFNRDNRRLSHGCIRVQNPREFAAMLTDQPLEVINQGIAAGGTTRNDLPTPVPVFVVYQTAFVDADGTLQFRPDFYNRDAAIWRSMQERPQGRVLAVEADKRPASVRPL